MSWAPLCAYAPSAAEHTTPDLTLASTHASLAQPKETPESHVNAHSRATYHGGVSKMNIDIKTSTCTEGVCPRLDLDVTATMRHAAI